MTVPNLTLVTPETPAPTPPNKPSPADKITLAAYVVTLKSRGFCKLDDASSNYTRLFNRFNGKPLPLSFIDNDFSRWLFVNKQNCSYCVFHPNWTPVPPQTGQSFQRKLDTCSTSNWTLWA